MRLLFSLYKLAGLFQLLLSQFVIKNFDLILRQLSFELKQTLSLFFVLSLKFFCGFRYYSLDLNWLFRAAAR